MIRFDEGCYEESRAEEVKSFRADLLTMQELCSRFSTFEVLVPGSRFAAQPTRLPRIPGARTIVPMYSKFRWKSQEL